MCPIDEASKVYYDCIDYLKSQGIELTDEQKLKVKEIIRKANNHKQLIQEKM